MTTHREYLEVRAWKTDLPASGSGDYYKYDYDRATNQQDAEEIAERFRKESKIRRVVILNRETGRNVQVWVRSGRNAEWHKPLGEMGTTMKRLTYGTMPSLAEFEVAFAREIGDDCYKMNLRGIGNVAASGTSIAGIGCYDAEELYEGIQELLAIWDSNIDADVEQMTEAQYERWYDKNGDTVKAWEDADPNERYSFEELRDEAAGLASSILQTLGFEWV